MSANLSVCVCVFSSSCLESDSQGLQYFVLLLKSELIFTLYIIFT